MKNRKMTQRADERIAGKAVGRVSVFLGMAVLTGLLSGCGSFEEAEDNSAWEIVHTDTGEEKTPNEKPAEEQKPDETAEEVNLPDGNATVKQQPDQAAEEEETGLEQEEGGSQTLETIYGNVKSISADSLIISRAFEEELEESAGDILVGPAEGSADEVLTTVFISENTKYEVHTVKNGGVNGDDDVEKREGTLTDIKAEAFVNITGSWKDAGFCAEKIVISYFV